MATKRARVIDRFSSVEDHFVFLGFYLVGALIVFIMRLGTAWHASIPVILLVLLVAGYAAFVYLSGRYHLREDKSADNVYYLGFLFTVTTLGVALIRYYYRTTDVDQIIGDLGLGLFTTIAGLIGRIILSQLRIDPNEITTKAKGMLAQAVKESRAGLSDMNEQMRRVRDHTVQVMTESSDTLKKSSDALDEVARKSITPAMQEFGKRIMETKMPEDILASKLQPIFDRLDESVSGIVKRLNKIQIEPDIIVKSAEGLFESLRTSINQMNTAIKSADSKISALAKHSEAFVAIAKDTDKLAESQLKLTRWVDEITMNQEKLGLVNTGLTNMIKSIGDMHESMQSISKAISSNRQEYGKSAESALTTMQDARENIEDMSKLIQRLATEFSDAMQTLVESANKSMGGAD